MGQAQQLKPQPDERRKFFTGFLKRPREVGSIIPSSRFMERRLVRVAELRSAAVVVELGPGTGGTSRAFLRAMRPDAQLVALEVNPDYVNILKRVEDRRFHVVQRSATRIGEVLEELGGLKADCVISGIPFSTMPRQVGLDIVKEVKSTLRPGGWFVAYQVRDVVARLGREVMGPCSMEFELLNVPPMRVYRWDKPLSAATEAVVNGHPAEQAGVFAPANARGGISASNQANGQPNGQSNGHDITSGEAPVDERPIGMQPPRRRSTNGKSPNHIS